MKVTPDSLKAKAQKKIQLADEEFMKPQEDVISFSICTNSRLAIQLLFESELLQYGIPVKKNESIALLLERCIMLNPDFKTIDLSKVDCRHNPNNHNYCSDLDKVGSCFNIAKQVEALLNK